MSKLLSPNFRCKPVSAFVALSLGLSTNYSYAQEETEPDASEGLEKIVVTAQKRAQNLQEVPVAVSAFTGEEMGEAVIKDLYDLTTNVPGFGSFQSQSATNSSFSIRGVGTSSQNFGLESSVGLYVDGVYRARQNSMVNNLVDVEAVEILRGPQGTLFGKNTPSGAVLVRTKAPSHDGDDGFVELTVGNYGLVNYAGAASISAIEDVLAFRVTAFGSDRDGTISDINLGEEVLNDRNRWGARLQALYTPSDDLSVRIIADYAEIDEICCGAPVQVSNVQANEIPGQFGTDAFLKTLLTNNFELFEGGDAFFDRKVAVSFLPESTMEDRGLSAEINWDLDDNYSIVSVSAYRSFDSFDNIDSDFSEAPLFGTTNDATQSSFSQELRLDYTSDKLNYILGAYYFTQDLDLNYDLYTEDLFDTFIMQGLFGGALNDLVAGIDSVSAATGGLVAATATASPSDTHFVHTAKQEHESIALFGQFDYKLTDTLTLTAGLRYTDESKDIDTVYQEELPGADGLPDFFSGIQSVGYNPADPSTWDASFNADTGQWESDYIVDMASWAGFYLLTDPLNPVGVAAYAPFQQEGWAFNALGATTSSRPDIVDTLEDDQITGTLKLSWQPDRNTLLYASFGTGYKSGGTNTDRIAEGFDPLFDAETSQSFELGIKKDFPAQDLRINAATHYTTVKDFQANTFTGNGFNLQNAGDYKISGLELEATWLPVDTVEVNFAYALVNAEYETFEAGNCWVAYTWHTGDDDPGRQNPTDQFCDRSGDRPAGEPESYAVVSVKKDFEISDSIYAYVLGEYSYTGEIILDGSNDPYAVQDAYNVLNLRLFFNFSDYDMDLVFWGRNILDEEYINRTNFNTPLQEGKLNAYMSEPATYGVTLRKRF